MDWYQLNRTTIEKKLYVLANRGLSEKQVQYRRKQYGQNLLTSFDQPSVLFLFMKQFQDFMVLILLGATLIAGLLNEYIDAIAIMTIVLLNGCIGFFQEQKAEKSLEKLQELAAPKMNVLREKEWITIPTEDAVVGDVVRIKTGDRIPADIRIIEANALEVDEATLTGESEPVVKQSKAILDDKVNIQDQRNIGFKGTIVTKGSGLGIIVHTGMNTAIGKIATMMQKTVQQMTPLELKLKELGKILIFIVFLLTVLTVGIGLYHGQPLYDMVLAGVSLAVAVIPEGLPAIVTVALSLGVQRMIKRKAIVRKISAVETLGCATIICTDKTGTITENKMTVQSIYVNESVIQVTGEGDKATGKFFKNEKQVDHRYPNLQSMALYSTLCNDATLYIKKGKYVVNGDPTDGALLVAARKLGITYEAKDSYKVIKQFPFDSTKKHMSVVIEDENKRRFLITKGAPEVIIPRCSYQTIHQERVLLKDTSQLDAQMDNMTRHALRMIAIAIKPLQKDEVLTEENLATNLTFIGLFGLKDPPRKGVSSAISQCKGAGIKTVMITGDHPKTAIAIANEVGMLDEESIVLDGNQLNEMPMDKLINLIEKVSIFARVTPEHKLKIVQAYQQIGHIVAMTGDGVNDAPAIKASNIGISMGISGTDVTKEASSLILLDDNFNTIKEAIREGRNIYENIRKFIRYLLASNVGEICMMLFAMVLALPLPLVPVQILWVNLVTDGLPAMALGLDPPDKDVMKQQPRNQKEGVFSRGLGSKILTRGVLIGVVSLFAFVLAYDPLTENLTYARTIAFTTLVLAQLIHVFDCRSEKGIFARNPFSNLYLIAAVVSSIILLLLAIYMKALQPIFHTTSLAGQDWLFIIVLSIIPSIVFGIFQNNKSNE